MSSHEPVISRGSATAIQRCRTPRTSESQAWWRRYRNDEFSIFDFRFAIVAIGNWQSAIGNLIMDAAPAAPEIKEAERQIARAPLVLNRRNISCLTERISGVVEQPDTRRSCETFTITASATTLAVLCHGEHISTG